MPSSKYLYRKPYILRIKQRGLCKCDKAQNLKKQQGSCRSQLSPVSSHVLSEQRTPASSSKKDGWYMEGLSAVVIRPLKSKEWVRDPGKGTREAPNAWEKQGTDSPWEFRKDAALPPPWFWCNQFCTRVMCKCENRRYILLKMLFVVL